MFIFKKLALVAKVCCQRQVAVPQSGFSHLAGQHPKKRRQVASFFYLLSSSKYLFICGARF